MGEWREFKLGDLTTLVTKGTTPTSIGGRFTDRGINYIKSEAVSYNGKLDKTTFVHIDVETHNKLKRSQLEYEDILYSMAGIFLGKNAIVPKDVLPANTNQALAIIRLDKTKANPKYIHYYLRQNSVIDFVNNMSGQSAQPNINFEEIKSIQILLPELNEQQSIASILSSLDDKIDLLQRQNKTLEQLAETLFRQWFVEEKIWDGKLSEYIKVQGGYAFKSQDFREVGFAGVLKITNISMGSVDIINTQFVDEEVVNDIEEEKFRANTGDFLIAMTGAEIGKIGMIEKTYRQVWVNQRVGKLFEKVPYGNIVGYLALKSREGQDHIINTCSGSAQENISSSGIEAMDFIKYSEKEVNSFGLEAKSFFEKILFNMNQIRTLTQLRDTLLPKLMSGEIRLNCDLCD
jgi:type I restriction enzyme S subunit